MDEQTVIVTESEATPVAAAAVALEEPMATTTETTVDKRAAKVEEDQAKIDRERGYRVVEWKPGITYFQSLITGDTYSTEAEMRAHHNELSRHGIVDPRTQ